jgi:glycosyltransferase involved in cell wall biosynthesis
MRIGIDARMYGSGFTGIGRYTYELIRHLALLDRENDYVVFLRQEAFDAFTPPGPRFRKVLADYPHYSLAEQTRFLSILNRENLDLMHFTHFNAPILYRRPSVVTIHDLTLSFFPGKKMNHFFRRAAYQFVLRSVTHSAKRIIAVSKHTQQDLMTLLDIPENRIAVVYNGVDPEFSSPSRLDSNHLKAKFGLHKPYFLYTGVWRDHKNLVGLLRAFSLLNREEKNRFQLAITGRPNPLYHEVTDTIHSLGLESDVALTGLVDDDELRALYQHALAYVFPSFYEGFGFPPLEAMLCGVPVAASNTSSIPEICGEGNALFFDPRNPEDMKDQMRRVATDQTLRQQLIERGLRHAKQFNWETMAKAVLDIYNSAVQAISYKL